jgi:hypothetical protein
LTRATKRSTASAAGRSGCRLTVVTVVTGGSEGVVRRILGDGSDQELVGDAHLKLARRIEDVAPESLWIPNTASGAGQWRRSRRAAAVPVVVTRDIPNESTWAGSPCSAHQSS